MNSSSNSEVRRCRPLLGTFVEITATGAGESTVQCGVNAAFGAIEKIQSLMSVHDAGSELSLVNREAASRPVTVSREFFQVLRRADRLAIETGGAFDYTIAPTLARWGYRSGVSRCCEPRGYKFVVFLRVRQVYFLRPLAIDLGGIAKGFGVDAAIKVLQRHGIESAVVNAGGDLRAFGSSLTVVHVRHPANPHTFARKMLLQDSALATSSPCFTEKTFDGSRVSHLVNSLTRKAITGAISVSVRAKECWLADALTKVVLNAPQRAQEFLTRYQAEAFVITA